MSDLIDRLAREASRGVVEHCAERPDIWLTHGLPGVEKRNLIQQAIVETLAEALRAFQREAAKVAREEAGGHSGGQLALACNVIADRIEAL